MLQSRKKLIAAAPIKDPQTGTLKTKVFTVEARAAFLEATTASAVNHENVTRCFELLMDESAEQTRRIQARMALWRTERGLALRQAADAIARRHWHAQRLLELHLPAGTVIRDHDGEVARTISITPIPVDRPPFPMPADAEFPVFFTIQPGGRLHPQLWRE